MKEHPLFSPADIAAATGARLIFGRARPQGVRGVSIDSRTVRAGDLFIAVRGRRFDGHDFIEAALAQGAAGAVVDRWPLQEMKSGQMHPIWRVDDTLKALGDCAQFHRQRFHLDVVAITGSSGKTTTKAMVAHLLSSRRHVLATPGTQNNRIGVPMALLGLRPEHDAAVLELGTNQWGEIRRLAEIARPTVGVITNVGPAHLETFGDLRGVLREKAGLWEAMDSRGRVVLPADDPVLKEAGRQLPHRVIWFGTDPRADVRASRISVEPWGSRCLINERWEGFIPLPGRHNLMNALGALACAQVLGEEMESAVRRCADLPPLPGRLTRVELGGCLVIHDAYNANPDSLQAALEVLKGMDCRGRRILVIGDMLELGPQAGALHAESGRRAVASGVDLIVAVGSLTKVLLACAHEAGLPREAGWWFGAPEAAGDFLVELIRPGDAVLIKGSRGMQMERIVECFTTSSTH